MLLAIIFFACFCGCNRTTGDKSSANEQSPGKEVTEIIIESADFTGSSAELEFRSFSSGEQHAILPDGGWLSFDVPVTVPGRYRTQVRISSGGGGGISCWIEDYVDNKDGRQYDITGSMEIPDSAGRDQPVTLHRDGSPLNTGVHKMKLHVGGGQALVSRIRFELLKKHQVTPQALTQQMSGEDWVVAWSDEFEQEGLPDTSKWTYDIGNWGWGNKELQYYTEGRPENARIVDGCLVIEARKQDLGEKWTSARLTTRGKISFIYGKIEFRAKVPVEKGNWSAGWTLGDAYVDELSWPYCGEIDILESVGYEIDNISGDGFAHASIHCGAYYFKLNNQPTSTTPVKNMNEAFHTYSVEWTPEHIKAFVDDVHYFTYDDTSDSLTWPYDQPQNIILNLAMGGGWGGARGMDESVTSQQILIDYIRVYERN